MLHLAITWFCYMVSSTLEIEFEYFNMCEFIETYEFYNAH